MLHRTMINTNMWMLYLTVAILPVIQLTSAAGCNIQSATSPAASSLNVVWDKFQDDVMYKLVLEVTDSTNFAPVIVNGLTTTQKRVEGLKPGHHYTITLAALSFLSKELSRCQFTTMTVPDIVWITSATAVSSSSIRLEWDNVTGADNYTVNVDLYARGQFVSNVYMNTSTKLSEDVTGLNDRTTYRCYVTASNVAGSGAKGSTRSVKTLVPPPPGVSITATGNSTARLSWAAQTGVLQYQVTVTDSDTSNPPVIHETSATHLDISQLEPCSVYTVGVSSLDSFSLPGEPNEVFHATSNINPVTTLSQEYDCTTAKTKVTWGHVFGANSYRATAADGSGESLNCTSNSTSCDIGMLKCGEVYTVRVTVISDDCSSTSTISKTFDTMPCAPANPTAFYTPFESVIVFQYEPTNNTIYYITQSRDKNDVVKECRTTTDSCFFTDVTCGQIYTFTVQGKMSVTSECTSAFSEPQVVITAPCSPTQVQTSSECTLGKLMTSWVAAAGAENYTVNVLGNIGNYSCTTSDTYCEVTGIPCGEHATVKVTASNAVSTTDEILAPPGATVPCTPINVSASINCSDNATISWGTSKGAIYYIVVTEDSSGSEFNVNRTMEIDYVLQNLACGETYTTTVTASNSQCNNSDIANATFTAAPCPPTNVAAETDCNNNQATITWDHQATTGSYIAVLEDSQSGDKFNCSSTNTKSCIVSSAPCGKTYEVTVIYDDGSCPLTSAAVSMVSGPCEPAGVTASRNCSSGDFTITWQSSDGADGYTATVTSGSGSETCTSTSPTTTCTVSQLACGQNYLVSVTASNAVCSVTSSESVTQATAPCAPTNVNAVMDCTAESATVTWTASDGAIDYTLTGHSAQETVTCDDSSLTCSLTNVQCGAEYSLQMVASDSDCSSDPSSAVTLTTAPCPPENVTAIIDCETNDLTVSWTPSAYTERYLVSASAQNGGSDEACNVTSSPCSISSVSCGKTYIAQVTAVRGSCHSQPSATASAISEPCVPQNLAVAAYTVGVAQVQWNAADGAATYLVVAVADQSTSVSNTSTSPPTELSGLVCGKTYNITVTANNDCDPGPTSQQIQQKTEPCPPTNVQATVQCGQQSAIVSWTSSENAEGYVAFLQNPQGHNIVCDASSAESSCEATGLQCGTEYTVSAIAMGNPYNSSSSSESSVTAEPCVPSNINMSVDCEAGVATVSWQPSEGAQSYVAELGSSDHLDTCTSSGSSSSCQPSHLHCGEEYNASVTAVGESCNTTGYMAANFYTEPCEVTGVTVNYTVGSAVVEWDSTKGATLYSAAAVTDQGAPAVCNSSSSTQCTVSGLQCSELYNVTVSAHNQACDSQGVTSDTVQVTTEPCPPTNIQASVACGQLQVTISWDLSVFAVGYIAFIDDTQGGISHCEGGSSDTSCVITGLVCSSIYSAFVVAKGTLYNSSDSSVISFTSEPCLPHTIDAQADCNSDGGTVSWVASAGDSVSVSHEVNGILQILCTSDQNNCVVSGLSCGQTYSLSLDVTNTQCTHPTQTPWSLSTRPCEPAGVTASRDCSSGDFTITWQSSDGADGYTATVTSGSGSETCTSTSPTTTCTVSQLACGQNYVVSVTASDAVCSVTSSESVTQATAPCAPTNVNAVMDCTADSATVTWTASDGAIDYTLTGHSTQETVNCDDSSLTCSLTNVQCGAEYSLQMVASDSDCSSDPSSAVTLTTAPCPPENVTAIIDCETNDLTVSWTPSAHTERYLVSASAQNGGSDEACNVTSSPCSISSVSCGKTYIAQVTAVRGSCHSQPSATASAISEPCVPQNLAVAAYTVGVAQVQWNAADGAATYLVVAVADQSTSVSNTSTSPPTELSGLVCGKTYNITVTANNDCDPGPTSQQIQQKTEPCPPTNVQATVQCGQQSAIVSWTSSENAEGYVAFLQNPQGHNIVCDASSAESSCEATGLQCGTEYTVSAIAMGNPYNSSSSSESSVTAEPCVPSNINMSVDCEAGVATVSWQPSEGAQSYVAELGSSDHLDTCTSSGSSSSCQPSHLHCGEEYNASVTAVGESCNTTGYMAANFYTEPCEVTGVTVNYTVGSAVVEWDSTKGATLYSAAAVTDQGAPAVCNSSSSTQCTVSGLQCSELYNVTVSAHNQACDSQGVTSDTVQVTTEPCPPTNIQASVACGQLQVTISWDLSVFAVGYIAFIDDTQGGISHCEGGSSDTSCVITGLVCSSIYSAFVVAKGTLYNSSDSSVISFTSEPCLPHTIDAQADCNSDGGTVSWVASAGDSVSVSHEVNGILQILCTSDQNNCVVSGLSCGQTYSLSLDVTNTQCTHPTQTPWSLSTRPCEPAGVTASRDCSSGDFTITWQSSDGADGYTATVTSGSGSETCTSTSPTTTCTVSQLACGQNYVVSVTASDAVCSVTSSESVTQATAPCAPTNVNAVMDCTADSATVTWTASDGAIDYTLTGHSTQETVNCDDSSLTCSLTNVQCGAEYSLQMVASDSDCSSDPSSAVTLTTAPCPPENVNAIIDCATNDLTVSWTPSAYTERYLVSASAQNGGSDEACNVTSSPCSFSSVSCGNTYIAQVTAVRGSCHSQPSATASAISAPCMPQNVAGIIDCVRNSARVSWNSSLGADGYTVYALGERDLSANCTTSTNTTCEVELECATHYNFTVTATNSQCEGPASAHIDLETAPCSLTGIRAYTQCHNSTILVEWDVEDGGTGDTVYTATAEDSNNNNISCNSTGTSCYLRSAQCGLRYTIMVSATSDTCNDLRSPPHHITTEPCQPDAPVVDDSCGDAQVSWTLSPIAEMYHVFAVGDDGHQHTYNTIYNNYTFQLHCNEQYILYVIASHENCSSLASQNATLHTGPCKPDNVSATYYCDDSSALLTWNGQSNAASYYASAETENGTILYRSSNTPNCTFDGLQCGSKYNFTVLATDGTCNSSYSDPIGPVGAVPCPPQNVAADMLPDNQTLSVSWSASGCSNPEYLVELTGSMMGDSLCIFFMSSYWTRATFFELPVPCGSEYSVTVEARNSAGTSDPSAAINGFTGGCAFVLSTKLT